MMFVVCVVLKDHAFCHSYLKDTASLIVCLPHVCLVFRGFVFSLFSDKKGGFPNKTRESHLESLLSTIAQGFGRWLSCFKSLQIFVKDLSNGCVYYYATPV